MGEAPTPSSENSGNHHPGDPGDGWMRVLPPPSSEHFPNISPTFSEPFLVNRQPGEGLGRGEGHPTNPEYFLTFPEHFRSHKTGRMGAGSSALCSEPFPNISEGEGKPPPRVSGGRANNSKHFPTIFRTLFRRPEPFDAIYFAAWACREPRRPIAGTLPAKIVSQTLTAPAAACTTRSEENRNHVGRSALKTQDSR